MLFSKIIVVNGINKFQFFTRYRYQQCMLAQARPPMINHLIIRLTHANVWESMGKPCSCMQFIKSRIFLLQVTRESISVLQVTWESVSGTASHARCVWTCNEIEGSYDKIIITVVPSYTGKNITRLLALALLLVLRTRNNTHRNKLVV